MTAPARPLLPRVLYVSTRSWNPGDGFIQMGVERLLAAVAGRPRTSAVYNKAPQVTSFWRPVQLWRRSRGTGPWSLLHGILDTVHFDNSHKRAHELDVYDAVVFSGSPGWSGPRLTELFRKLDGYRGEVFFLGIGTPNRRLRLTRTERRVLERALVVTREEPLATLLGDRWGVVAEALPCPALFSAPAPGADGGAGPEEGSGSGTPGPPGPVGFVFSTRRSVRNQAVSDEAYDRQLALLDALRNEVEVEVVCHYSDDLDDALTRFGEALPVHYHFDPRSLLELYRRFGYVVSTRVHGCGAASSLGIPNALLGHDRRAGTVRGFRSLLISPGPEVLPQALREAIRATPAARAGAAAELRQHRLRAFRQWTKLLADRLGTDPPRS